MILVLPIKTLLFFCAMGMSTYTILTFLLTASPLEIQFLGILLNMLSAGIGMYIIFNGIPQMIEAIHENRCRCSGVSSTSKDGFKVDRYVEEKKDGSLIITATYTMESESENEDEVEEAREIVENTPPPTEPPTEDTNEFADLLEAEKKVN